MRLLLDDNEFLTRSQGGTVWGKVYFKLGDQFFPEHDWTDMVVAFAGAWLEALIRIANQSTKRETVWFLDGPFSISLFVASEHALEITFLHKDAVKHSTNELIANLLKDAVSTGSQLLRRCKQNGWLDHDTETLQIALEKGSTLLKKKGTA